LEVGITRGCQQSRGPTRHYHFTRQCPYPLTV